MVALLEYVMENKDEDIRTMIPQLSKIIFLLREICLPEDIILQPDLTPGMTPTPGAPPAMEEEDNNDDEM